MKRTLFSMLAMTSLFGAGCSTVPLTTDGLIDGTAVKPVESNTTSTPTESTSTIPTETTTSTTSSTTSTEAITPTVNGRYERFAQVLYQKSLQNKRGVILYFHANWCPICEAQHPRNEKVFKDGVLGVDAYKVHTKDNVTNAEETALATAFRVNQQHTFIFIDSNGKEFGRKIGALSEAELKEFIRKIGGRL